MTRALFLTTQTSEVENHILAWESVFGPAERLTFSHRGIRNDWILPERAALLKPDVLFYIGACEGAGNPRPSTFRELRKIAPLVNLCSDATDHPWHPVLLHYRTEDCFDLQVSIDGASEAPVDLATLTPVDPALFQPRGEWRDIRCGFSGSIGQWDRRFHVLDAHLHDELLTVHPRDRRAEVLHILEQNGQLTIRQRVSSAGYAGHAQFLRRCKMLLNTSWTGTGKAHHIKGRVLEAGWAGCGLLEPAESPIADWFPENCYIKYDDKRELGEIIDQVTDGLIAAVGANLAAYCAKHYHPSRIYGQILERLGLVCTPVAWPPPQSAPPECRLVGHEGDPSGAASTG